MSNNLTQLERQFLYGQLGDAVPREPLNNMWRRYCSSLGLVSDNRESLNSLMEKWLDYYISDNSLTPVTDTSGKWAQMVTIVGETPSKFINDNKRKFYTAILAVVEIPDIGM